MTRTHRFALPALLMLTAACAPLGAEQADPLPVSKQVNASDSLATLPLSFIENRGQADPRVGYYLQGADTSVYFTDGGLTFSLADRRGTEGRWAAKLDFVGADPTAPRGSDLAEAVVSYFKGSPEEWKAGLPTYSGVSYPDLWPGIDLSYSGDGSRLKYELMVRPGADPGNIRMAYRGADVALDGDGSLAISTPAGDLTDDPPRSWQVVEGRRVPVESSFRLNADGYGFALGSYDPTRPLVIDPAILVYAGFLGGSNSDVGYGIAVDPSGAAYLTGYTTSTEADFPEAVGPDLTSNGLADAFVAKVSPSGASLVYAGFLGGSGTELGHGIAVDPSGAAYLTGYTTSTEADFPVAVGPDLTSNGLADAFVVKVAPSGASLSYAGFLGGSGDDYGQGVAVDPSGAAHLTGHTFSTAATFPVAVGPDLTSNGLADAFVAKVSPPGASLVYAGFLGGSAGDYGQGVAVDPSGAAYLTGYTESFEATFPEAVGPDLTYNGSTDAFVAKVAPSGASLVYAGFLGGSAGDYGYGVAVDPSGAAYLAGYTDSTEATFPVAVGADLTANGVSDAFVAKVTDNVCLGKGMTIQGTAGADTIAGTAGDDVILALGGDDRIIGAGGNDTICAGDGNDTLIGGPGDDALDGEAGTDTASYPGSTPVKADLAAGTATSSSTDTLAGIENLVGSDKKDVLKGDGGKNVLKGGKGKDRLIGRGGNDRLLGGGGGDRLSGGGGKDALRGGGGDDILNGGPKKDSCSGGAGSADTATACETVTGVP